ncbi:MAG: hypothetical protein KGI26_04790 [Thaumarchaeota archaeon]|nr:hypothetical protein [Nitrososphaerota archaeon]
MIIETTNGAVDISVSEWLLFKLRGYAFAGWWAARPGGPDAEHWVYACKRCGKVHADIARGFDRELRCNAA